MLGSIAMPNVRRGLEFVEEWRKMWEPDMEAIAFNGATCDPTRVDSKVLQWVKSNCAKKPHFIKVINETAALGWLPPPGARDPGRHHCKMMVPRPFVREHFRKLGRVITLENGTTHKEWKVSFGTANATPSWLQGWKRVVIGNRIIAGDVMIFVLTGDSHFVFYLFDEHGLPKVHFEASAVKNEQKCNLHTHVDDAVTDSGRSFDKCKSKLFDPDIVKLEPGGRRAGKAMVSSEEAAWYPTGAPGGAKKIRSSLPDSELTDTDMAEEKITTRQRTAPMRREGSAIRVKAAGQGVSTAHHRHREELDWLAWILIKSRRRIPTTMERKRAMEQANAHAELLLGSHFLVVLSETQVYRDFHLPLPERFGSDSGLPRTRTRLTLVDRRGKEWEMYSRAARSGVVAFHRKYWGVFALQHRLEEGDVCVFQLINKDTFTISVSIFRVVKLDRSIVSVRDHYDMRMKPHH